MTRMKTQDLLIELIKIPSTSKNQAQVLRALKFIESYIKENTTQNLTYSYYTKNDCHNLIIKPEEINKPKLTLYSHIDVVDPCSREQFSPIVTDEKIYGRGAGDMKCGTAIEIHAFLDTINKQPNASIALMIVGDEEIGGTNGTKFLLSEHQYKTDCVYMPDSGSGLDTIITDQKGILFLEITVLGLSGHGSRPHEGENAILKAMNLINEMYSYFEESDPKKYRSTINVSKIEGGKANNQVPDICQFTLDIRFTDLKLVNQILNTLEKKPGVEFQTILFDKNFHIDKSEEVLKIYHKVSEEILESKVDFRFEHGGSDGRYFQNYNIPCIMTGIKKAHSHGPNEWVDTKELQLAEIILKKFIEVYI